jgi:transcriptional regulator with XRE-family HTH domain
MRRKVVVHATIVDRFRRNLFNLRGARGLGVRQLAGKMGCSPSYITMMETGLRSPSLDMITRVAKAMDVDVSELIKEV